jgi:hypothetical protein
MLPFQSHEGPEAIVERATPPCVYCGCEDGVTVDHVPPKLLLARPYPENLLTVPACKKCNKSFQANDEYTRFVASIDLSGAKQRDVQSNMPAILRSLQRPEARGFSQYLAAQMTDTTVLGPDGRPLGQAVDADRNRLNASGERMVRGLFFVESGNPLPSSTQVRIACKPGITASNPAIIQFASLYSGCPERRDRAIGDAFSYVAGFRPEFSIWLLMLYGHFTWLATIGGSIDAKTATDRGLEPV